MPQRWSHKLELAKYKELYKLYIVKNKSIGEIAPLLSIAESTVYDRLLRLNIQPCRSKKPGFNHARKDISIPSTYSEILAEFLGIMLGDGCLNRTQVTVTLGTKELEYVKYVAKLITKLFKAKAKICRLSNKYYVVYLGSVKALRWLISQGLVHNKVKSQVGIPEWIFTKNKYSKCFLKGFFDTDGSVYKLKFGVQLAFINRSHPLLEGIRKCLLLTGYHPSKISLYRVYITRKSEVKRFFREIGPANPKHTKRFLKFAISYN